MMAIHFSVIFLVTCWLGQLRMSDASTSEDCGAPGDPLHFSFMMVTPDPVILPGNATVEWTAELSRAITGLTAILQFSKFNGSTWQRIDCPPIYPCSVNFCILLGKTRNCTLDQGPLIRRPYSYTYTSSIPSGKYQIEFIFLSGGNRVGCVEVKYEVKAI